MLRGHPELLEARSSHVGETPLHWLAIENRLEAVQFLARMGADINIRDAGGSTSLVHAAMLGHLEMVGFLLAQGADPNLQEVSGWTALHMVAKGPEDNAAQIAGMLLEAGADPAIADICGDTPADIAAAQGNHGLAAVLRGAKR
jgi:ankyrin repeat protein